MAPAARGMGHRRRTPAIAAVVGRGSGRSGADTSGLRPDVLPVPGNARVGGAINPAYAQTFVFDNDHPCVGVNAPRDLTPPIGIYRSRPATGVARVVCYSPRHDLTLAELDVDGVDALLETWQRQMRELAAHQDVTFVLIFENKGEVVGVSNPHPHCQIYATNFIFKYIETELEAGRRHLDETGHTLFTTSWRPSVKTAAGLSLSMETPSRSCHISHATPTRHTSRRCGACRPSTDLTDEERRDLATVLRDVVIRFDNLWRMPFPYVMVLHQAPLTGATSEDSTSTSNSIHPCAGRICSSTWPVLRLAVETSSATRRRRKRPPNWLLPVVRTIVRLRSESPCDHRAPLPPAARAHSGPASPHTRAMSSARVKRQQGERSQASRPRRRAIRSTRSTAWLNTCSSRRSAERSRRRRNRCCWWPRGCRAARPSCRKAPTERPRDGSSSSTRSTARAASCTRNVRPGS